MGKKKHRLRKRCVARCERMLRSEASVGSNGFIPSSPLLFKRTVRRPELRKIVPSTNTTIYEMEQHG